MLGEERIGTERWLPLRLEALDARASREVSVTATSPTPETGSSSSGSAGDGEAFRGLFGRYAPSAMAPRAASSGSRSSRRRSCRRHSWRCGGTRRLRLAARVRPCMADGHGPSPRRRHRAPRESQRRRVEESQLGPGRPADPAEDIVDEIGLPEERRAVRAALDELPAEQRQVIELMYFDGLSQSKISDRLRLPLGTVVANAARDAPAPGLDRGWPR